MTGTSETIRWRCVIEYRTDAGIADVEHFIDELSELHALVELGPNFYTVHKITIDLLAPPYLTVEQASKL